MQLPPATEELEGAIELDDLELGATLLGAEDEGATELGADDEAAPSQVPSSVHSCH